ncbi:NfeD family protein [Falsirhodobacter halotolerans]|uniref:NfeD family protein n=1 Tax=Falsirhodobacter halotolerans TaxID=1146892 RepID=UPI001FD245FB|nr:hypothetical protein [Falsirhodobacter halotolerans]MCJ8141117.1 hypothetical protein [Falsirhodobacter halotolerans]
MLNGWLWLVAALVLAGVELILPAWVFLGIAGAVAVMGLALLSGLWTADLPLTLVATAALSGVIWILLRRMMGVTKGQVRIWDRDIND